MIQSTTQSRTYYIKHVQRVAFDVPVFCEPTAVRLHPRLDDLGLVHWAKLDVTPATSDRRLQCDANGNTYWQLSFSELTIALTITVSGCVELNHAARRTRFPGRFAGDSAIGVYRRVRSPISSSMESLIQSSLRGSDGTPISYLNELTTNLTRRMGFEGVCELRHLYDDTSLSTRLLAAAVDCLANAGRAQGIPARIVRGYEASDADEIEDDTKLWVEFFLEDRGWVAFDPLSGLIESGDWIPLAKGATLEHTNLLDGLFRGSSRQPEATTQIVIRRAAVAV